MLHIYYIIYIHIYKHFHKYKQVRTHKFTKLNPTNCILFVSSNYLLHELPAASYSASSI